MKIRTAIGIALLSAAAGPAVRAAEVDVQADGPGKAYALVVDGQWRTGCSVRAIEEMRRRFRGDYLWLRRDGRTYIVRDPARLAEAQAAFDRDGPELRALRAELKTVARQEQALDRERDRAEEESDALSDSGERDDASDRRLDELEAQQRTLGSEIRALEQREEDLDRRTDALEMAAETRFWVLGDRWISDGTARPVSID